jgi:RNA polymerase sigma factor (sigma-70 family)
MSYIYSVRASGDEVFKLFILGYERGLTSLYNQLSRSIYRYGMMLVKDEFIVNSIVQEAFLKAWTFRERLTSLDHTRRFLKLTVRWECMHYYRNSKSKFYRSLIRLDWLENIHLLETLSEPEETNSLSIYTNELLRIIPSLPNRRQRCILELHLIEGLSPKEISLRLQLPVRAINDEIQNACIYLRSLLTQSTPTPDRTGGRKDTPLNSEQLTREQRDIYSMRYSMRYSFLQIAELLKLPQPYVQQQYVVAHKTLQAV